MIKKLRLVHFYLGVFFAPTIIFFSFSGMLQTFSLHENHNGLPGIPWVTALAEVHKNQRVPETWTAKEPAKLSAAPQSVSKAEPVAGQPAAEAKATSAANPKKTERGEDENDEQAKPAQFNARAANNAAVNAQPAKRREKSVPLKVFIALMSLGLIVTSLLGIYMAFKYSRGPALIWGLLVVGTALPISLLYM